jgi:hypothetical protein
MLQYRPVRLKFSTGVPRESDAARARIKEDKMNFIWVCMVCVKFAVGSIIGRL